MKMKILFTIILLHNLINMHAQNIGIGITEPLNKLHVLGNLLINAPYISTNTAPTLAQTKTMTNGSTIIYGGLDSTGRLYDPGGANGDYVAGLLAYGLILNANNSRGYELTLDDVDLGTGDSLIITVEGNTFPIIAVGNGYTTVGKWIINAVILNIQFKSNNDGQNGRGFSLLFRRLFDNTASQQSLSGHTGKAMYFDTKNGSFRAGLLAFAPVGQFSVAAGNYNTASGNYSISLGNITTASGETAVALGRSTQATGFTSTSMGSDTRAIGNFSTAMGSQTNASAPYSTALGKSSAASGDFSIAMGNTTIASGNTSTSMGTTTSAGGPSSTAMGYSSSAAGAYSTAMGYSTNANGENSTAMGYFTTAGGYASTAMGLATTASGNYSTAMGNYAYATGHNSIAMGSFVSTSAYSGAFALGDNSTTTIMESLVNNGFSSRFVGGYRLFTTPLTTGPTAIGALLFTGQSSWSSISDVRRKENFIPVNGELFLEKISLMPLTTWNYKTQDVKTRRHYGPMAQDFYKAFGHDDLGEIGDDTTINQQDFLGVNLIAIQALEKRTTILQEQLNKAMELIKATLHKLATLEEENAILRKSAAK